MTTPAIDDERLARAALTAIVDPGDGRLNRTIDELGAAETLAQLKASSAQNAWTRRVGGVDEEQLKRWLLDGSVRFIIPGDQEWPASLDELDDCDAVGAMRGRPIGLWLRGSARLDEYCARSVAIVGARAATNYGAQLASRFASNLGAAAGGDFTVISGGAYGIDAAAHRGALAGDGRTMGVYAGGLHESYPKANTGLFDRMIQEHVVVSEAPPGRGQTKPGFLARNRLIAALSKAVIVVEAAARSGALNTASWADALSRPVLAVPGPVNSQTSTGCHRLIRDGRAQLVSDEDDIRAVLLPLSPELEVQTGGDSRPTDRLDRSTLAVHEALPSRGTRSVDEIAVQAGLTASQTLALLAELELLGMAKRNEHQRWCLSRPIKGCQAGGEALAM